MHDRLNIEPSTEGPAVYAEYRPARLCFARFNGSRHAPASFPPLPDTPFVPDPDGSILRSILLILGENDSAATIRHTCTTAVPTDMAE
ncbi:hypothetical protein V9W64_03290 [Neisseria leonii]|uniref:Uncharacterized protein n=1 Tax=Neisseria leonii TaxID=2995413 RepID=A0A9X4IBF9_9NEIS|nr:hypothetical protein [Neisseria sp. 51.81]MDD9328375.1 hypothetical protein [Neisseria sp. 51.81]